MNVDVGSGKRWPGGQPLGARAPRTEAKHKQTLGMGTPKCVSRNLYSLAPPTRSVTGQPKPNAEVTELIL